MCCHAEGCEFHPRFFSTNNPPISCVYYLLSPCYSNTVLGQEKREMEEERGEARGQVNQLMQEREELRGQVLQMDVLRYP